MSQVACRALSNVLSGMPQLRNSIVLGMVRFVVGIDDFSTQVSPTIIVCSSCGLVGILFNVGVDVSIGG